MSDNLSELDILYSPSRWSKRLPPDIICQEHIDILTKNSEVARKNIPCELEIPYGPNPREKIDIFGTDLKNDAPILIFIHGGYWQEEVLNHSIQSFIAHNLYKYKIKTICIGYELCPTVSLPELMQNIEKALIKCIKYAKTVGTKNIHCVGHSAGAQLVAALFEKFIKNLNLEDQKLFKNVFLLGGVYDLSPLIQTEYNKPLKLDEKLAKITSPMYQKLSPPAETKFFVIAAEYDSPAFVKQSKEFYKKLLELKIDAKYTLLKGIDHFDMIENLINDNFELSQILLKNIQK